MRARQPGVLGLLMVCSVLVLQTVAQASLSSSSVAASAARAENDATSWLRSRRRLDALPGFDVGTKYNGMDIVRNGVVAVWQKWDTEKQFAKAGLGSNLFYVWLDPEGGPAHNVTFQIASAVVVNSTKQPNEAACAVNTTPPVGTPITAGNFSQTFTAEYTCGRVGQVEIELTLDVAGYSTMVISYFKTVGNALDMGLTLNGSEVVALGRATAAFSMTAPQYTVPYEQNHSTFFLRMDPTHLLHTRQETRTSDFVIATQPDHVIDFSLTGSAVDTATYNHSTSKLEVQYTCKDIKTQASTVIQVRPSVRPW